MLLMLISWKMYVNVTINGDGLTTEFKAKSKRDDKFKDQRNQKVRKEIKVQYTYWTHL